MQTENQTDLLRAENDRLRAELKSATEPSADEKIIRQKMEVGLTREQAISAIKHQRDGATRFEQAKTFLRQAQS